jgi:hypothetical protein
VAAENFYTIDRLLAANSHPVFGAIVDRLGKPETRDLLRYLSSELNRLYFQIWNIAQVVLAAIVLMLIAGTREHRILGNRNPTLGVWAMFMIVLAMLLWLTPEIVTLGRSLDFVPRDPAPAGTQRFWMLHTTYTSLEMLKLLIGVFVTIALTKTRTTVEVVTGIPGQYHVRAAGQAVDLEEPSQTATRPTSPK